jgi:hypothetical protein
LLLGQPSATSGAPYHSHPLSPCRQLLAVKTAWLPCWIMMHLCCAETLRAAHPFTWLQPVATLQFCGPCCRLPFLQTPWMLGWITADTRPCTGPPTLVQVGCQGGSWGCGRESASGIEVVRDRTGQVKDFAVSHSPYFPPHAQDMKIVWSCYLNTAHSHIWRETPSLLCTVQCKSLPLLQPFPRSL